MTATGNTRETETMAKKHVISHFQTDEDYWEARGWNDAQAGRGPLFADSRRLGVHAKGEPPNSWTLADEKRRGRAYLRGYDKNQ